MRIDEAKFVACGNYIPVCPVGAIYIDEGMARFCICGVFNTVRAETLFEKARKGGY